MENSVFGIMLCAQELVGKKPAKHRGIGQVGPVCISFRDADGTFENLDTYPDLIMQHGDFVVFKGSAGNIIALRFSEIVCVTIHRDSISPVEKA